MWRDGHSVIRPIDSELVWRADSLPGRFIAWVSPDKDVFFFDGDTTHQQVAKAVFGSHPEEMMREGWVRVTWKALSHDFRAVSCWNLKKSLSMIQGLLLPRFEEEGDVSVLMAWHHPHLDDRRIGLGFLVLGTYSEIVKSGH